MRNFHCNVQTCRYVSNTNNSKRKQMDFLYLLLTWEPVDCVEIREQHLSFAPSNLFAFRLLYIYIQWNQNRRQKVSMQGLCVCAGGLDIQKIDKMSTDL